MMKKILANAMSLTVLAGALCGVTACGTTVLEGVDADKTQLYIASFNGGNGYKWLDDVEARFEEAYAETSFEEGKKGVQVIVDHSKSNTDKLLATSYMSDTDLYFLGGVEYYQAAKSGYVKDITELMKAESEFDGKTLESKLTEEMKSTLAIDGKYYALPYTGCYNGVSYDADLFNEYKLYFSNQLDTNDTTYPGTNAFVTVKNATNLSCGPDAVYGTYDDGLPSTYQEFYKLMDRMIKGTGGGKIIPFAFNGVSTHYTNMLMSTLAENYVGRDAWSTNFVYNSNGEKVEIVTGFNGNTPIVEEVELTEENAYLIRSSLGMYYASEFCEKVFTNEQYYDVTCAAKSSTNLATQERFLKSGWDNAAATPIAMIIEGAYWYNEAIQEGIVDRAKRLNPNGTNEIKDVRFMPMPHQYAGTVTPQSDPIPQSLTCYSNAYCLVNAYIPESHYEVAKLFLSFCYSDAELEKRVLSNNGLTNDMIFSTDNIQDQLSSYAKAYNEMVSQSAACGATRTNLSQHPIFLKNEEYFRIATDTYWDTQLDTVYTDAYSAFYQTGCSAIEYFQGLALTKGEWDTKFRVQN